MTSCRKFLYDNDMKYLSFDLEATGLEDHDLMIEFACIPVNTETTEISDSLSFHRYIKCPSFEELLPKLNPWVAKHNKELIEKAHEHGVELKDFINDFQQYLESAPLKSYFHINDYKEQKITLFGKSMQGLDFPLLNRDLGREWLGRFFSHRSFDLTVFVLGLIDAKMMDPKFISGSELSKHYLSKEVAHTALDDAINVAKIYFQILSELHSRG